MGKQEGGCHCGEVRFEVVISGDLIAYDCNCSICCMAGYLHLVVEAQNFTLLRGENALTTYKFNTNTAKHYFCNKCGVKSFYIPRSHPNSYSVNVRCLDNIHIDDICIKTFDGANWEHSVATFQKEVNDN